MAGKSVTTRRTHRGTKQQHNPQLYTTTPAMECTRKIGTRCNKITVSKQPHAADTHPAVISAACFAALYTTQLQNPPRRSNWHAPSVTQHRTNTHLAEDSEPDTCSRVCCCWMLHLFPLSQDCTYCAAMQSTCLSLSGCSQPSRRSIEVHPVTPVHARGMA